MRLYKDEEWDTLPHIIWTSDDTWDSCIASQNLRIGPNTMGILTTGSLMKKGNI